MSNRGAKGFNSSSMDALVLLMQFKELEKARQEIAARRKNSKNPFMEVTQKTDHSVYKELYKFDIKVIYGLARLNSRSTTYRLVENRKSLRLQPLPPKVIKARTSAYLNASRTTTMT